MTVYHVPSNRSAQYRAAKEREAKAAASTTAAKPTASQTSPAWAGQAARKIEVDKARAAERERVRAVFASPASKGRERLCADLLSAPDGWSAAHIVAKLPTLALKATARANAKTDAVWEAAYGKGDAA